MVIKKQNLMISKVKDIALSSAFVFALLSNSSCSESETYQEEIVQEEVFTKGIKTHIKETEKGVFKIIDEDSVSHSADSRIFVEHFDGHQDTLTLEEARHIVEYQEAQAAAQPNPDHYIENNHSLGTALVVGGVGYMCYSHYHRRREEEQRNGSSSTRGGYTRSSSAYINSEIHAKSQRTRSTISTSKTTISRPAGSRSGFFGASRSSHSSSSGYHSSSSSRSSGSSRSSS
ncbi:MAG: hypothetical protein EAZ97_01275 [Bacteroidetes bacterium]|nr:MAG: hypothetical protein EAZ97_01275 [Bacteroidota bacterium]